MRGGTVRDDFHNTRLAPVTGQSDKGGGGPGQSEKRTQTVKHLLAWRGGPARARDTFYMYNTRGVERTVRVPAQQRMSYSFVFYNKTY